MGMKPFCRSSRREPIDIGIKRLRYHIMLQPGLCYCLTTMLTIRPWISNGQDGIISLIPEINDLSNKYLQYLEPLGVYRLSKAYLRLLMSLVYNNVQLCDEAIKAISDERALCDRDESYLDLLYFKAHILEQNGQRNDAISLLKELSLNYKGDIDKAFCWLNIGLDYMCLPLADDHFINAETEYKKAAEIFKQRNMPELLGNADDGLSYCLILQKRFKEAECYAYEAVNNKDYQSPNKYCNYISSLLCQGKFIKAWLFFYLQCPCRADVYKDDGVKKDWKGEMHEVGINTDGFEAIFHLYERFRGWKSRK